MTDRSDLVLVFDLAEAGYRNWLTPGIGLIFLLIAIGLVRDLREGKIHPEWASPVLVKFFVWGWFAATMTIGPFVAAEPIWDFWQLSSAYKNGRYEVLEGPVERFEKIVHGKSSEDFFVVGGRAFKFRNKTYDAGPDYRLGQLYGGAIGPDSHVRILHINGRIVRLETDIVSARAAEDRWQQNTKFGQIYRNLTSNEPVR